MGRPIAAVRAEPAVTALVVLAVVVYASTSILRHDHFGSGGFDLGIFDQTVWHYSQGETPASSIENLPNILSDHFSPGLALLAPLFWLWNDPRMLLVAQALLIAGTAVPILLFARPRVGRGGALMLAAAYLAFWGVASAVGFDFHEVALAPPLIAGALLAFDRRRTGIAMACVLGLLAVKEDQSFLVMAFGLYALTLGHRRAAAACVAAGLAWYAVITGAVMPSLGADKRYAFWSYDSFGRDLPHAALGVLERAWRLITMPVDHSLKVHTLLRLLVPWLGLVACTRVGILALPLLGERLLSSTANYWTASYHYSLTIAPVLACGAADGIATLRRRGPLAGLLTRRRTVPALCATVLLLNLATMRPNLLAELGHPTRSFANPPGVGALRAELAMIPPGASVATEDAVVPWLSHRRTVAELSAYTGETDWVIVDYSEPVGSMAPNQGLATVQGWLGTHGHDYRIVMAREHWLLLRRRTA